MQTSSPSTAAELDELTTAVATAFSQRGWTLAVAESCTGGLLAASLTDLAGSSQWFERGYVTYSNTAKTGCLQVSPMLIEAEGAVSEAVASAMALRSTAE
jgi:nicotinamide-nucleotide amidase